MLPRILLLVRIMELLASFAHTCPSSSFRGLKALSANLGRTFSFCLKFNIHHIILRVYESGEMFLNIATKSRMKFDNHDARRTATIKRSSLTSNRTRVLTVALVYNERT